MGAVPQRIHSFAGVSLGAKGTLGATRGLSDDAPLCIINITRLKVSCITSGVRYVRNAHNESNNSIRGGSFIENMSFHINGNVLHDFPHENISHRNIFRAKKYTCVCLAY